MIKMNKVKKNGWEDILWHALAAAIVCGFVLAIFYGA